MAGCVYRLLRSHTLTSAYGMRGSNIGLAGCGIRENLRARCGMKIGRRDRYMLHFECGIGDRTGKGGMVIKGV